MTATADDDDDNKEVSDKSNKDTNGLNGAEQEQHGGDGSDSDKRDKQREKGSWLRSSKKSSANEKPPRFKLKPGGKTQTQACHQEFKS